MLPSTLVNRTQKVLDKLISDSQTGFIKDRNIGESIQLVYDIINYCDAEWGDKQGDPISPYLFIICGQIMCFLIKHNPDIKGINIGKNLLHC